MFKTRWHLERKQHEPDPFTTNVQNETCANENEKPNEATTHTEIKTENETNFADRAGNKTNNETKTWNDGWGHGEVLAGA